MAALLGNQLGGVEGFIPPSSEATEYMTHSRLVLQGSQVPFKWRGGASHCSRSKAKHHTLMDFFHMLRPKSLKELLEIESFLTCLGKLCLVLCSTVLPMFVRTPEVVGKNIPARSCSIL